MQSGVKLVGAKAPYFFLALTLLPIFFFSSFVPAYATTSFYYALDSNIDRYLFGSIGFGSSRFPLTSKVVANYICLCAPVFALVYSYLLIKHSKLKTSYFESQPLHKFILFPFLLILVSFFVTYVSYFDYTDLIGKRKMYFFGVNGFLYALYSSFMMFMIYSLVLGNIMFFRYYPVAVLVRVRRFISRVQ